MTPFVIKEQWILLWCLGSSRHLKEWTQKPREGVLAAGIRNLILSVSTSGFVAIRGFPEFLSLCSNYAQHEKLKWLERQTPIRNGEQQQTPGVFVTVCSCLCSVLPPTKVSTHQRHRMFLLSSRVFSFSHLISQHSWSKVWFPFIQQ